MDAAGRIYALLIYGTCTIFVGKKLDLSEFNCDISCEIKNSYSRCAVKAFKVLIMMSSIIDYWLRTKVYASLRMCVYCVHIVNSTSWRHLLGIALLFWHSKLIYRILWHNYCSRLSYLLWNAFDSYFLPHNS